MLRILSVFRKVLYQILYFSSSKIEYMWYECVTTVNYEVLVMFENKKTKSPFIVALDFDNEKAVLSLAERLDPALCRLKVGKQLFTSLGPAIVDSLHNMNFEIFLDLKFHDIPNTAQAAVVAAAKMGVWMVNVHALGGRRMMDNCREALDKHVGHRPLLTAVTILTSIQKQDLDTIGMTSAPLGEHVLRLAQLADWCGLDGVICSAIEAKILRACHKSNFCLVTPGIRPDGFVSNDQQRVMTPNEALLAGSTYMVVGRPITQSSHPEQVLAAIISSLIN